MQRQLRFELRTASHTIPTASVREWRSYVQQVPPPPDNNPMPLEWWLQQLIFKYPNNVPKDIILPRLLLVYKVEFPNKDIN